MVMFLITGQYRLEEELLLDAGSFEAVGDDEDHDSVAFVATQSHSRDPKSVTVRSRIDQW